MDFRTFTRILLDHGFVLERQRGSHRVYKGVIDGQVRLVVVAGHRDSDDVKPGTLASMIRQSSLPRKLFR
jgi:predicted RNA binding protein YcfA (HicA-like mRNA interferase family)